MLEVRLLVSLGGETADHRLELGGSSADACTHQPPASPGHRSRGGFAQTEPTHESVAGVYMLVQEHKPPPGHRLRRLPPL